MKFCNMWGVWDRLLSLSIVFSKFIHIVGWMCQDECHRIHVSGCHRFLWPHIPLSKYTIFCFFIHLLIDIWAVSTFGYLWMMLLFTLTYNVVCGYVFPFLFGTYPGMQLLGHVVTLITEEVPDFSKAAAPFYTPWWLWWSMWSFQGRSMTKSPSYLL